MERFKSLCILYLAISGSYLPSCTVVFDYNFSDEEYDRNIIEHS
jgi:hypothetical protein